jgi:hypothetical protein
MTDEWADRRKTGIKMIIVIKLLPLVIKSDPLLRAVTLTTPCQTVITLVKYASDTNLLHYGTHSSSTVPMKIKLMQGT